MNRGSSLKLTVPLLVLLLAVLAYVILWGQRYHYLEDPAIPEGDPSLLVGDEWDRRAAEVIDDSRGTDLESLVTRPGTEREVVDSTCQLMSSVVFENAAAATAWQSDPVHDEFRERLPNARIVGSS